MAKKIKAKQTKYLVVSYDSDQQQWFYDFVIASGPETAVAFVCEQRPYVEAADATGLLILKDTTKRLATRSFAQVKAQMDALETERVAAAAW